MDPLSRLKMLGAQMRLEADADRLDRAGCSPVRADELHIQPAQMPGGKQILLLKTMITSACERDCYYCPFRAGRDFRRATFSPDELAETFMQVFRMRGVEGIFLSSGIAGGGVRMQDKLLAAAELLRRKHGFRGYVHLKIMPGAEKDQVRRAMQLADRVSLNLEAPNSDRLARLAPHKEFLDELLLRLKWVAEIRQNEPAARGWAGRWPSSTTQFVAGGADESDVELLQTSEYGYRSLGLKRVYYMAFDPVRDTPMENRAPTPPQREARLYQASFLLRDYGFSLEEMPFQPDGNLPLHIDPKRAWAEVHLRERPVDLQRAERRDLLRVPGIGPRSADAILAARRGGRLRDLSGLRALGVLPARAAPYVLLDGRRPSYQPALF